jgi:carbonic anhydrase
LGSESVVVDVRIPGGLTAPERDHHHADISTLFDRESVAIMDYEKSLRYDVGLLRSSPAVPKLIKLYGFFFDINSGKLSEVVRDVPT